MRARRERAYASAVLRRDVFAEGQGDGLLFAVPDYGHVNGVAYLVSVNNGVIVRHGTDNRAVHADKQVAASELRGCIRDFVYIYTGSRNTVTDCGRTVGEVDGFKTRRDPARNVAVLNNIVYNRFCGVDGNCKAEVIYIRTCRFCVDYADKVAVCVKCAAA